MARDASHVTRHTSHVICHSSHVTHYTSHVTLSHTFSLDNGSTFTMRGRQVT